MIVVCGTFVRVYEGLWVHYVVMGAKVGEVATRWPRRCYGNAGLARTTHHRNSLGTQSNNSTNLNRNTLPFRLYASHRHPDPKETNHEQRRHNNEQRATHPPR
jgi:hypothetical protein